MKLRAILPALAATMIAVAPAHATDLVVIHGIPLDVATNVDVCVTLPDGTTAKVIEGFNFGEWRALRGLPGGTYAAKVIGGGLDCSAPAAFDLAIGPVDLLEDARVAVVAYLKPSSSTGVALDAFPLGQPETLGRGQGFLGAYHVADAPTVDVIVNGRALVTASNGIGAPFPVNAQPYAVWLSLPGRRNPIVNPVDVRVPAGGGFYIFAVGSLADGSFRYVAFNIT
jgi:hypothetical protein